MYLAIYIKKKYIEKLKKIAEKKGVSPSTIVRMWMEEKLEEDKE